MVHAYDEWARMPLADIYDTQMMLAQIGQVRDMYEKGAKQLEDFHNKYDDFMSPITKDMEWHEKNVIQKMQNTINDLYARGIDPLRSAEGRSAIAQLKNSIDTGRIARNKISAANAQTYLENAAKLGDEYNPDYENRFLGYDLNNFDSSNGVWGRLSPSPLKSLKALTESSYNNMSPRTLTKEDVESVPGYVYDPNAQYTGTIFKDLLNVATNAMPGLVGTENYGYYRDLAKRQLQQEGNANPTESDIDSRLALNIANQHKEYLSGPVANYKDYFNREQLKIARQKLAIAAAKAAGGGGGGGSRGGMDSWTTRQQQNVFDHYKKVYQEAVETGNGPKTEAQYYKMLQTRADGEDKLTAFALFAGMSSADQLSSDGGIKRAPISFGNGDLFLTKQKQIEYYKQVNGPEEYASTADRIKGIKLVGDTLTRYSFRPDELERRTSQIKRKYKHEDIYKEVQNFQNWLEENSIEGFIPNTNLTINYNNPYGYDVYDINGKMRIRKDLIMDYFNGDTNRLKALGKEIGLVYRNGMGKVVSLGEDRGEDQEYDDKQVWANIEYIDIPVTRTTGGTANGNDEIDMYHESRFSKAQALKNAPSRNEQSDYDEVSDDDFFIDEE